MDRYIEFEKQASIEELRTALEAHNPGILILHFSKLTGTLKIRFTQNISKRKLRRAFMPHRIKKIYTDFPMDKMVGFNADL